MGKRLHITDRTKELYIDVYNQSVYLIHDKKSYNFLRKRNGIKGWTSPWGEIRGTVIWLTRGGVRHYIIVMNSREADVVAHECVHLAQEILSWKGVPITLKNSEALAYLVGHLYRQVAEVINHE